MATLTLLDVDQLPIENRNALAHILACYGAVMIAVYPDGAMHCSVPQGLEEALLATIARDVIPVALTDAFALVA